MMSVYHSRPIVIGDKGKPITWKPLQELMEARLGRVPSLAQKLSAQELYQLGFTEAARGEIG